MGNPPRREAPLVHGHGDFFRTDPPIFHGTKDPLDADYWLGTIEQKLGLLRCHEHDKVIFAAHQLQDVAGAWWCGVLATHPRDHRFTWEEFRMAFCAYHIPKGIMDIKKKEFLSLTQGNNDLMTYLHAFNALAPYAPKEVASDAKKRERFYEGLSEEMQDKLSTNKFVDFNDMVDVAIQAEHKKEEA
ncbi:uncharacterized protein [Setaria viridis]|uniref:uncharacterized protein n=1 Tax=Setaria viridis TaxID=4556 RepID=UPI003B3A2BDC